ncbi:hypothetical protein PIB30_011495 [Stylosanthes scabra]|uniref:Ubiquitin-like protease family profile domain-containing protein n=1 Tax=Stylosanthes scabra TaxID=79078 RepID=A0ABU6S670_9FABA|nr:hypothetical protein [Stylosanthes scabra]
MTRADFQCVIAGNEILMLATLKTNIARDSDETFEEISDKIITWSFPPQFGVDALNPDMSRQVVFEKYKDFWILKSSALKYIYVPLIDGIFHWFLMVVSIDEGKVYKLDSYPNPGRDISKNFVMRWAIYVPLIDGIFHWFLMVVSIDEGKVYKLDSYPNPGRDISKNFVMRWAPPDSKFRMLAACANLAGSHNEIGHMVKNHSVSQLKALVGN